MNCAASGAVAVSTGNAKIGGPSQNDLVTNLDKTFYGNSGSDATLGRRFAERGRENAFEGNVAHWVMDDSRVRVERGQGAEETMECIRK